MDDAQIMDVLTGTTAVDRRRLRNWFAGMNDQNCSMVMAHQTGLMRQRDGQRRQYEVPLNVWANAMLIVALFQLRHAREGENRKRRQSEEEQALVEKYRQGLACRKGRGRGRQATVAEFVRANYEQIRQWREAGISWWKMPDLVKEYFGGRHLSRAALQKAFVQIERNLEGAEEIDHAKTRQLPSP